MPVPGGQPENLGEPGPEHRCAAPDAAGGYRFSKAMENPGFIGVEDIQNIYLPMAFPISRLKAAAWAAPWSWNSCSTI